MGCRFDIAPQSGYNTRMNDQRLSNLLHPTWRCLPLVGALVLLYLMIFSFSAQDADTSAGLSERITRLFVDPASPAFPTAHITTRKLAHAAEFALLFLVWHLLMTDLLPNAPALVRYGIPMLFTALSAVADELSQLRSPGRACSPLDMLIDISGAILMALLVLAVRRLLLPAN